MNTAARLSAYGAAVVLLGAGAFAVGSTVGAPADTPRPAAASAAPAGAPAPAQPAAPAEPGGLASSRNGYTLVPLTPTLPVATPTELAYRITGPDGAPVTRFEVGHDKQMHLVLVRRDTADFQHVHPVMSPDGTWRVPVTLAGGGSYRAFADFVPTGGPASTLGVDLSAPGRFAPVAPEPNRTATAPGGYQVTLDGDLTPGRSSDLTLTVSRNGRPVTNLQPYLGAYGHLVALRTGDLGYVHVHPDGTPGDGVTAPGPGITFHTEVPSAGTYRLFLDFQHGGEVRTVQFTVPTAGAGSPATPATPAAPAGGHGHDAGEGGH
ncbi:hypothetical protein H7X46_19955 [Pseudonocardia sp. C8]|uniref:hypothetical protein n=1 Tax=Pseudonocardia sp. C8 TaxID=2762759 RepID=UPI0016435DBE|nr:hypothetical protein [Pseudonocardia sp. C8]MBC3193339.1 hypothetical protein [Pseudonocardia sp. C8]